MRRLRIVIPIAFLFAAAFMAVDRAQAAEQYPVRPINFIVPNEAGADADILARALCQKASALLGQPIIIVNKPGAGSSIGYRELHGSKPDGYTIGYGHATIIINKLMGILPFDHEGLTMICTTSTMNPIMVASTKTQRPFKTIQEAITFAKSHPGQVSVATSGVGQSWWVATVAFEEGSGAKFNIIPQPGTGGFVVAQVAGGHTELGVLGLAAAKPKVEAGNIRLVATFGTKPGVESSTLKETAVMSTQSRLRLCSVTENGQVMAKLVKALSLQTNPIKEIPYRKSLLSSLGSSGTIFQ
jgi:tripartite-type tricarboxylate transporter receptor subunit TctC